MVDYSTLTELELYRDAQTGEFIARDPSDGTEYAVPFEELNAGTANIDSLGQSVDAGSNDITNIGEADANSVSTDALGTGKDTEGDLDQSPSYDTWVENTNSYTIEAIVFLTSSSTADFRVNVFVSNTQSLSNNKIDDGVSGERTPLSTGEDAEERLRMIVPPGHYYFVQDRSDNAASLDSILEREWSA